MENLLQLVADPSIEFEEDNKSVQEILKLVNNLPSVLESTNINTMIEQLNSNSKIGGGHSNNNNKSNNNSIGQS